jgi:hypothetical protein
MLLVIGVVASIQVKAHQIKAAIPKPNFLGTEYFLMKIGKVKINATTPQ